MPPFAMIVALLLVAYPLVEIAVLIKVGSLIGVWLTLAIIVGTFVAGIQLIQHQGLGVARCAFESSRAGTPPIEPAMESMLLVFAGGCLMAPGLISDAIGLILMVPPIRQAVARWGILRGFPMFTRTSERPTSGMSAWRGTFRPRRRGPAPTIEAEYQRLDETPANARGQSHNDHERP